jgi:hypothetical protein
MRTIVGTGLKERLRMRRQHQRATRRSSAGMMAIWVAGLGALVVLIGAGILELR